MNAQPLHLGAFTATPKEPLFFGADILARHWRLLLLTIIPMTLYLSAADTLAIVLGIWTIDPARSLGIMLGGRLPVEEFVFFMLTTVLVGHLHRT